MRDGKPVASRIKVPFHFAPPAPPPEIVETPEPANQLPVHPSTPGAVGPATLPASKAPLGPAAPSGPAEGADASQDVQVRGRLEARSHGTSDYKVTVGELQAVPRTNASDALKLAPGFLLTNEGGSGHAEQVFLRGFDAHEGQDLEFTVDGVPINDAGNYHGNGYADTHFIIPELIHSVRVLEGPYAPQQGDFAVAGSADYQLGLDRRGLTAEYAIGSFNTQRLLLLWGPSDAPSGTFARRRVLHDRRLRHEPPGQARDGDRPVRDPGRRRRASLRINATAYATEYNSAGRRSRRRLRVRARRLLRHRGPEPDRQHGDARRRSRRRTRTASRTSTSRSSSSSSTGRCACSRTGRAS